MGLAVRANHVCRVLAWVLLSGPITCVECLHGSCCQGQSRVLSACMGFVEQVYTDSAVLAIPSVTALCVVPTKDITALGVVPTKNIAALGVVPTQI